MNLRISSFPKGSRYSLLINNLCNIAHGTHELNDLQSRSSTALRRAILNHDSNALFSWLMRTFSYQGISDRAVDAYIAEHGNASYDEIERNVENPSCLKLRGFWSFNKCGYEKLQQTCSCRPLLPNCGVPQLPLRNGRLNQLAFSLYFFIRDVANGDLIDFLDNRISGISVDAATREIHETVSLPWRSIFGVSDKVITMALSTLLMSSPRSWHQWQHVGRNLIVVDSLVHNFLHRTGASHELGVTHLYGNKCYQIGGCFDVLDRLSHDVDARRFNFNFPMHFPRFVQLSIWRYCSSVFNICNGNRIDDKKRCLDRQCHLHSECRRIALK